MQYDDTTDLKLGWSVRWRTATGNKSCRVGANLHTAISRKVVGENVHRQSRKVIWDTIDTLFLTTVAVEPTFFALR